MALRWLNSQLKRTRPIGEQKADFYDASFSSNPDWALHYTASPYYFVWTVLIDRIRRRAAPRILEIACGPGQLARAIHDAVPVASYVGLDFSSVAIALARRANPDLDFRCDDALTTTLLAASDYDLVVCTEFLEHVESDRDVIGRARRGAMFLGTVPNFPYVSHVRHFRDVNEVSQRYAELFDDFSVVAIKANEDGKTFFLLEGRRR